MSFTHYEIGRNKVCSEITEIATQNMLNILTDLSYIRVRRFYPNTWSTCDNLLWSCQNGHQFVCGLETMKTRSLYKVKCFCDECLSECRTCKESFPNRIFRKNPDKCEIGRTCKDCRKKLVNKREETRIKKFKNNSINQFPDMDTDVILSIFCKVPLKNTDKHNPMLTKYRLVCKRFATCIYEHAKHHLGVEDPPVKIVLLFLGGIGKNTCKRYMEDTLNIPNAILRKIKPEYTKSNAIKISFNIYGSYIKMRNPKSKDEFMSKLFQDYVDRDTPCLF
jgi:hypothetical protein